mmetsp:Transcript_8831/g.26550  ORF Transcript_8831/g.26550 Transcript_8831/m.26550 type:complete len:295 (+) Transcript_8831:45-929(+)
MSCESGAARQAYLEISDTMDLDVRMDSDAENTAQVAGGAPDTGPDDGGTTSEAAAGEVATVRAETPASVPTGGEAPMEAKMQPEETPAEEDVQYEEIVNGDFLEPRRDALVGEAVRKNVLHLYGVDLMSTDEIKAHFGQFGPKKVEWINDSSCNIVFEDEQPLKTMFGYSEDTPDGDGAPVRLDPRFAWMELPTFTKGKKHIHLYGRMATVSDTRPEKPSQKSAWSRTVQQSGDLRSRLNRIRVGLDDAKKPEDLRERIQRERSRRTRDHGRRPPPRVINTRDLRIQRSKVIRK